MKYVISRYNHDLSWLSKYTDDYVLYDRSEVKMDGCIPMPNIGSDWYDKLTYIIDNYDDLPDVFMLLKANIFKYITESEFNFLCHNTCFTPLLTQKHSTYYPVCYYDQQGRYNEINNLWFLGSHPCKCNPLELMDLLETVEQKYVKFAPGSNYIVTREVIHRRSKEFYSIIRSYLDWDIYPGEAQIVERGIYNVWKNQE